MSAAYRLRQFQRGLLASLRSQPLSRDEEQLVDALLPPAAAALFARQPVDAQRHSLGVLYDLRRAGHNERDLWVAALLHDVGKVAAAEAGVPITLWLRGPLVLLETLARGRLRGWASADPPGDQHRGWRRGWHRGWRYALHVHLHHPAIGAAWAQSAGCRPLACWLIAHHQNDLPDDDSLGDVPVHHRDLLVALQQADNRN